MCTFLGLGWEREVEGTEGEEETRLFERERDVGISVEG